MRLRTITRTIALAGVVGIVAAACGGGGTAVGKTTPPSSAPANSPKPGGSVVLGAEQWPQCVNPITSCAEASWLYYPVINPIFPRAMMVDLKGNFVASPLLTEAPSLANGDLQQNPFTVTFKINPQAKWEDGSPITSADFEFTWKAIMDTKGTLSTVGYDQITSIDTTDPKTAVVHFKQVVVDWPDLFGGSAGWVIKKAAFPNANANKPDLSGEMTTSIPFSGGPWKMQSWSKQQEVLVPNTNYWGHKPYLSQVTFIPIEDQPTEINSLLSGQVKAIFPQPSNVSLLKQFSANPNVSSVGGNGNFDEGLWFNLQASKSYPQGGPVDDLKVRQAIAYAVDRTAVVNSIVHLNNPSGTVQNCGMVWFPGVGPWCPSGPGPFAQYTYNPQKAMQILQSDGYDCSKVASGGFCQKNGKDLTIQYNSVAGNARRETTEALLKEKAKAAGINFDIKNFEATDLFSNKLPKLTYGMAEFANGGVVDPSVTSIFACANIPTAKNGYAGQNTDAWCNKQADALMKQSDQELDPAKRAQEIQQIGQLEAQDLPALPLYVLPNVFAWRKDALAGPLGQYVSSVYGPFFNMDYWYQAS